MNINSKEEHILISTKEYQGLIRSRDWLRCLESAGIDNSEAYDYACELWQKDHPNEDQNE
jgi:hypothetical protein